MLWLTVSKAFCKSINTTQTDFLLSSDFSISSISSIITWEVEKSIWKVNYFYYRILCSFRKYITLLCISFSMILSTLHSNKTGL